MNKSINKTKLNKLKYGVISNFNNINVDKLNKYDYSLNNLNLFLKNNYNCIIELINSNDSYIFFKVVNIENNKKTYIKDMSFKQLLEYHPKNTTYANICYLCLNLTDGF